MTAAIRSQVDVSELTAIRADTSTALVPLSKRMAVLAVVDAETYHRADGLLSQIANVRAQLEARIKLILSPLDTAKREIEKSRKEITRFRDELDRPLADMETDVRGMMREFKLEERRLLEEAEQKRIEEQRRLRQEAEEAQRKADAARNKAVREQLQAKALQLEDKAEAAMAPTLAPVVGAAHSTTRKVFSVKVTDLKAVLKGVLDGTIPEIVIDVEDLGKRADQLRRQGYPVEAWEGCTIVEDLQIVRRG